MWPTHPWSQGAPRGLGPGCQQVSPEALPFPDRSIFPLAFYIQLNIFFQLFLYHSVFIFTSIVCFIFYVSSAVCSLRLVKPSGVVQFVSNFSLSCRQSVLTGPFVSGVNQKKRILARGVMGRQKWPTHGLPQWLGANQPT